MNKMQGQVREFHREILDGPTSPAEPKIRHGELRARLILEEAIETVVALVGLEQAYVLLRRSTDTIWSDNCKVLPWPKPNLIEAIDGCIDTLYVVFGTLEDIGVDAEPFMDEVHRANMAKRGGSIDANGKQQKPPGWKPPDIEGVLKRIAERVK